MKALVYGALLLAMVAFGFGAYHGAALLKGNGSKVIRPSSTTAPALPGTVYLAQGGALYRFRDGQFTQITGDAGWTEPAASPDGSRLVAVMRKGDYSDLYLLTSNGHIVRQLTHHRSSQVESNHWSFFPRFSADGTQVFYSYDAKDPYQTYRVDLSIFAIAVDGSGVVQWTTPNYYTGGDVNPVPLKSGALIYTKYSIDDHSQVHSQVWAAARPGSEGVALTQPDENCNSPAVSSDEKSVAMVCRHDQLQTADLVIASLDTAGYALGTETTLVHGHLVASPSFSPDGQTVAFLAPVADGGSFQLWTVPAEASRSASTAHPLTTNVGLDSTAAPVWVG